MHWEKGFAPIVLIIGFLLASVLVIVGSFGVKKLVSNKTFPPSSPSPIVSATPASSIPSSSPVASSSASNCFKDSDCGSGEVCIGAIVCKPPMACPDHPGTCQQAGTVSITNDDYGKTISVKLGTKLVQSYKRSDLKWIDQFDTSILQQVSQNELTAIGKGTTQLESEGRPDCKPGMMCAQFIEGFKATITVN